MSPAPEPLPSSSCMRSRLSPMHPARLTGLLVLVAALLLPLLGHAAPAELTAGNGWSLPEDVSAEGWRIDHLLKSTMFFVVLLFAAMTLWIGIAMVKHGKDHKADYDHGNGKSQVTFALIMSAVIFFVVDGNLFVNSTWDTTVAFWNFAKAEGEAKRVRVEVNARQWAWDIRYAGPDGTFNTEDDIVTLNDLRIPEGAPVIIELTSSDVLHSIYLPHLRQKIDAVPGTVNHLWFEAKKAGRYEIACAQHCGMAHYKMAGVVTVMPQDEYAEWAARATANAARAYDPNDKEAHWGWPWRPLGPGNR